MIWIALGSTDLGMGSYPEAGTPAGHHSGTALAVRNDNPMPYTPGNLAEARLLMQTLCRDWTEELMKGTPDWRYLDDLHDWIEEADDVIANFELDESMGL